MTTRRDFLKNAAIIAAGFTMSPSLVNAFAKKKQAIGIQLYSLRDIIGKDVRGVIAQVAKAGFREVETYGYNNKNGFWGLSAKDFKALLNDNGLTSPSGHFDFNTYFTTGKTDKLEQYIEASAITGTQHVICPYFDGKLRKEPDAYKKLSERLNKAGELALKSGVNVGYHNHGFEFDKVGDTTGFDIILNETDPNLVAFELDLYWAVYAGYKPTELFAKYPNRFKFWHVKDMDKNNKKWNTEIGNGTIDYASIFKKASLSGVKHIYLEQETNYQPNHIKSITTSIDFIQKNLLK